MTSSHEKGCGSTRPRTDRNQPQKRTKLEKVSNRTLGEILEIRRIRKVRKNKKNEALHVCKYDTPTKAPSQPKSTKRVKKENTKKNLTPTLHRRLTEILKEKNRELSRLIETRGDPDYARFTLDLLQNGDGSTSQVTSYLMWVRLRRLLNKNLFYAVGSSHIEKAKEERKRCVEFKEFFKTFGIYGEFYDSGGYIGFKVDINKIKSEGLRRYENREKEQKTKRGKFFKMMFGIIFAAYFSRKQAIKTTREIRKGKETSKNAFNMIYAAVLNNIVKESMKNFEKSRKYKGKRYDKSGEIFKELLYNEIVETAAGELREELQKWFEWLKNV